MRPAQPAQGAGVTERRVRRRPAADAALRTRHLVRTAAALQRRLARPPLAGAMPVAGESSASTPAAARGARGRPCGPARTAASAIRLAPGPSREVLATVFAGTRTTRGRAASRCASRCAAACACGPRLAGREGRRPADRLPRQGRGGRERSRRTARSVQLQFRLAGPALERVPHACGPTRAAASATPTASATTTAAACASSSAPTHRARRLALRASRLTAGVGTAVT